MNGKYLLDTNVIIDYLQGVENQVRFVDGLKYAVRLVSLITRMELLSYPGLSENAERKIEQFLSDAVVIGLNSQVEREAIALKRANRLKLPDSIVVATACVEEALLVTRDRQMLNLNWQGLNQINPDTYNTATRS